MEAMAEGETILAHAFPPVA